VVSVLRQIDHSARQRIETDAELRQRLQAPFQLLDYEKSRLQMMADLQELAQGRKVRLDDGVLEAYPQHSTGLKKPALLWAQLAVVNQALTAAIVQEPRAIEAMTVLPPVAHGEREPDNGVLEELAVGLEMSGPPDSIHRFLASLPLRSEEIKVLGGREVSVPKAALFVQRIMLRNATNNLNEAHLDIVVSGFVLRPRAAEIK
jgi:hypothetical protein